MLIFLLSITGTSSVLQGEIFFFCLLSVVGLLVVIFLANVFKTWAMALSLDMFVTNAVQVVVVSLLGKCL